MNETWKPIIIKRRVTNYDVSDQGRVRRRRDGRIKAVQIIGGYRHVGLYLGDREHGQYRVAPLVMKAFKGPRPRGKQIEHDNQNKLDDRAKNLLWVTQSVNIRNNYARTVRRHGGGSKHLSQAAYDLICDIWNTGLYSQVRIARATGLTNGCISKIVSGAICARPMATRMILVDYDVLNAPVRKPDLSKHMKYTNAQIRRVRRWRGVKSSYWVGKRFGMSRSYVFAIWNGVARVNA